MIVDSLANCSNYFSNKPAFSNAICFIKKALTNSLPVGQYEILGGDRIFAKIMSYSLKDSYDTIFESHKKYVDIQASLTNAEGMEWFLLKEHKPLHEYNSENDVFLYNSQITPTGHIDVFPGSFIMFFPHDVHKPQLKVHNIENVKKVVVKIEKSLLL